MKQDYAQQPRYTFYNYNTPAYAPHYSRRRRKQHSVFLKIALLLFVLIPVVIVSTAAFVTQTEQTKIISPLVGPIQSSMNVLSSMVRKPSELDKVVAGALEGSQGEYSVVIRNLSSGEEYSYREHEVYDSASLYKLWTMGTVYEQIEDGKISLDDTVADSVESLNARFNLATGEAELQDGEFSMTIDQALERMITISHNYAALLLSSKVKIANVSLFLQKYGLTDSKTGSPPKTTAFDIARYYELLYRGELVNKQRSSEMIERLKRQQLNDRIPKLLPEDIQVAHKTGELGQVKHDAGIVFTEKGDYIIVMLSRSNSPMGAAQREAEISKAVYDYFQSR